MTKRSILLTGATGSIAGLLLPALRERYDLRLTDARSTDRQGQPVEGVIVVNRSLAMPKGKLAAQVAHAAVGAFLAATAESQATWLEGGMPKIVVYAADADALMQLEARAQAQQIPACLVRDAGRTVLSAGTITCLGLGPAPADALDPLTGDLQLV